MLAALRKWGLTPKFYDSGWRTHNRNTQQGWGPLRGLVIHNFGSSGADLNQLAYLYRGDGPTSSKPGPLSQFAVTDDGQLWVMGWGTATHAGPGDPKAEAKARANALPLTSEHSPTTIGTDPGTVTINPHYLGVEQCHGPEGPTAKQRATTVRWAAAMLDMLGGPVEGYGAGSVLMHRELTKNRSDPQDIPKDGTLRREIAALLTSGPGTTAGGTTPTPAPVEDDMPLTDQDIARIRDAIINAEVPNHDADRTDGVDAGTSLLRSNVVMANWRSSQNQIALAAVQKVLADIAGKVGVDVDENALAAQILAGLTPAVRDAVIAAGQPDAVADAVVAKLGAALTPTT
jgi:hypothetical protein